MEAPTTTCGYASGAPSGRAARMAPSWAPSSCCALSTAAAMPFAPNSAPGGEGGDEGEEPKGVVAGTRTARPTVIGAPDAMEAKQPKSDVASRPSIGRSSAR